MSIKGIKKYTDGEVYVYCISKVFNYYAFQNQIKTL